MFLSDSTKYDIVVILVFFSELFDGYPIRGLMRKVFYSFLVGTACTQQNVVGPVSKSLSTRCPKVASLLTVNF